MEHEADTPLLQSSTLCVQSYDDTTDDKLTKSIICNNIMKMRRRCDSSNQKQFKKPEISAKRHFTLNSLKFNKLDKFNYMNLKNIYAPDINRIPKANRNMCYKREEIVKTKSNPASFSYNNLLITDNKHENIAFNQNAKKNNKILKLKKEFNSNQKMNKKLSTKIIRQEKCSISSGPISYTQVCTSNAENTLSDEECEKDVMDNIGEMGEYEKFNCTALADEYTPIRNGSSRELITTECRASVSNVSDANDHGDDAIDTESNGCSRNDNMRRILQDATLQLNIPYCVDEMQKSKVHLHTEFNQDIDRKTTNKDRTDKGEVSIYFETNCIADDIDNSAIFCSPEDSEKECNIPLRTRSSIELIPLDFDVVHTSPCVDLITGATCVSEYADLSCHNKDTRDSPSEHSNKPSSIAVNKDHKTNIINKPKKVSRKSGKSFVPKEKVKQNITPLKSLR